MITDEVEFVFRLYMEGMTLKQILLIACFKQTLLKNCQCFDFLIHKNKFDCTLFSTELGGIHMNLLQLLLCFISFQ